MATNNLEQIVNYTGTITDKSIKETQKGAEYVEIDVDDGDRTIKLRAFQPKELIAEVRTHKVGDYVSVMSQDKPNPQAEGTFFHNMQSISGATQSVSAQATAPTTTWGSIDERIAWNSAINNANHATKPPTGDEGVTPPVDESRWVAHIIRRATLLYPVIRSGPTPIEEDPFPDFEELGEEVIEV